MTGFIVGLFWFLVWGTLSQKIAASKQRSEFEGFVVGGIFGPLGALIELLLPKGKNDETVS